MWLLNDCGYAINHAGRMLSMLKTIGLDAQKKNHSTHPYVAFIHRFSLPAQDKIIHMLSFKEMKKVEETIVPLPLENAKKWLIIGFWIGQQTKEITVRFLESRVPRSPERWRPKGRSWPYVRNAAWRSRNLRHSPPWACDRRGRTRNRGRRR